jgi:hypothetical protein
MQECHSATSHAWRCAYKFIKWGLGFFLFGILLGFAVLIHYLVGSKWNTGVDFLSNITLWFGSPLTLSVSYLQIGGLAMAIVGVTKLLIVKCCSDESCSAKTTGGNVAECHSHHHEHGRGACMMCVGGLIALFLTGFVGYFVIDGIWPGFYYAPILAGKNLWLVLQGISLLVYFIGMMSAVWCLCHCCKKTCHH